MKNAASSMSSSGSSKTSISRFAVGDDPVDISFHGTGVVGQREVGGTATACQHLLLPKGEPATLACTEDGSLTLL
ncbi:hypothetical protein ACQB60_34200 [Actinomycetota bacterium Odt1-20B]